MPIYEYDGKRPKIDDEAFVSETAIIVGDVTGADFVFEDGYNLLPLHKLEQSIKQNKHLPDIPSAKEMEENGLTMGEFQIKLLQKIEELTLYMIELKKDNDNLKEQISTITKN